MAQYLDQFMGTMSETQTKQILKLLNKQKNAGQIRTLDEFNQRLDTLIRDLTSTAMRPTLQVTIAEANQLASTEQFNFMLERTEDDLKSAFDEANKINEVQQSHEALIRDVSLKNIRAAIAELDAKISVYEFINKDDNGFDASVFSTFSESQYSRTTQAGSVDKSVFNDPRIDTPTPMLDAEIELVGERLVLASSALDYIKARSFRQIFDQDTQQSYIALTPPSLTLSNVIDNTPGTYWVSAFLCPPSRMGMLTEQTPPLVIKFELDLALKRSINFLEIVPANVGGLYLVAVHYVDSSGLLVELLRPNPNGLDKDSTPGLYFNGPLGLKVRPVFTNKLIFTFKDTTVTEEPFLPIEEDPMFSAAMNRQATTPVTSSNKSTNKPSGTTVGGDEKIPDKGTSSSKSNTTSTPTTKSGKR